MGPWQSTRPLAIGAMFSAAVAAQHGRDNENDSI
jgi:hypothetical protein